MSLQFYETMRMRVYLNFLSSKILLTFYEFHKIHKIITAQNCLTEITYCTIQCSADLCETRMRWFFSRCADRQTAVFHFAARCKQNWCIMRLTS